MSNFNLLKQYLPESFIVSIDKGVSSGDFYWFTQVGGESILAAIDCSDHRVAGSLMRHSISAFLDLLVTVQKFTYPGRILRDLNQHILNGPEPKEGMDIAICRINHASRTIDYAGAMRPLWIANKGTLTELKGDKFPIGTTQDDWNNTVQKDWGNLVSYRTHTIQIQPDDTFYLFTDGYTDQFGGKKNKKFSTKRFKELVLKNHTESFPRQENNIKLEHSQWKGNNEQVDDILVIGFKL